MEKIKLKSESSIGTYDDTRKTYSFSSGHNLMPAIKFCIKCGKASDKVCVKCSTPYCSFLCRTEDNEHERNCNANNKIVEIQTKDFDVIQDQLMEIPYIAIKKSNSKVKITCIIDHRNIFVRLIDENKFISFMNDVAKYAQTAEKLKNPMEGMMAIASFEGIPNRVLLLKKENSEYMIVAFIDFGNVGRVKINDLKCICGKLRMQPRFANKVVLRDVTKTLYNVESLTILQEILIKDVESILIFDDDTFISGKTECTLIPKYSSKSINLVIKELNEYSLIKQDRNLFHYVEIPECDEQCENAYGIEDIKIDGKHLRVIVLDHSRLEMSIISFIEYKNLQLFLRNHEKIQNFGNFLYNDDDLYTPR